MAIDTTKLPGWETPKDITTNLAAGSLTVSKALVYKWGTDTILELQYSDTTKGYVKFKNGGRVKVGGADNTFGTGTEVTWQS